MMDEVVHCVDDCQAKNKEDDKEDGKETQSADEQPDFVEKSKRHIYSKNQLIAISKSPSCKNRPNSLESCYTNPNGKWDPQSWHANAKIPSSTASNTNLSKTVSTLKTKADVMKNVGHLDYDKDAPYKRKIDPRERIREESQDDIVLSPQRRSFGTGCHIVPNKPELTTRPTRPENHSYNLERTRDDHILHRHEGLNRGRVGSGRIIERNNRNDWSKSTRDSHDDDLDNRRSNQRSFSRSYEFDRRSNANNNNSNNRSRYQSNSSDHHRREGKNYEEEEEPEWFSAGPTSQNDFIELRGFDEDNRTEENESRNKANRQSNLDTSNNHASSVSLGHPIEQEADHLTNKEEFDINEIFKMESWQNMDNDSIVTDRNATDGMYIGEAQCGTSRFAQWFSESRKEVESPIDRLLHNASHVSTINSNPHSASTDSHRSFTQINDHSNTAKTRNGSPNGVPMPLQRQQSSEANNFENGFENDLVSLLFQKANISVNQLKQAQQSLPSIRFKEARSLADIEANIDAGIDGPPQPNDITRFPDNSGQKSENVNVLYMLEERMKTNSMIKQSNAAHNRPSASSITNNNGQATIPKIQNQIYLADHQLEAPKITSKEEEMFAASQQIRASARNGHLDGSIPFYAYQTRHEAPFSRPVSNPPNTNGPTMIPKPFLMNMGILNKIPSKISKAPEIYPYNQQIGALPNRGMIDSNSVHIYPQNSQQQDQARQIERQSVPISAGHWLQEMLVNRARTQSDLQASPSLINAHPMQVNSIPLQFIEPSINTSPLQQFNSTGPPSHPIWKFLPKGQNLLNNEQENRASTNVNIKTATGNVSAFTPTSVMRKFASDKDKDAIRKSMRKM